jgi:hypothetical protein
MSAIDHALLYGFTVGLLLGYFLGFVTGTL